MVIKMKLTLSDWNKSYFARPRSRRMLSRYIRDGKIFPTPVKVGREYEVEDSAILLTTETVSNTSMLVRRINEQKARREHKGFTT